MSSTDTETLRAVAHAQVEQMDADFLRTLLHSQLQHISPAAREASAVHAVTNLNRTLEKAGIPKLPNLPAGEDIRMQKHLQEMRENGLTLLGPVLNAAQVKDIHASLEKKKVYGGHVWAFSDRKAKTKAEIQEKRSQASYQLEDVLSAPHLAETISSPFMLKLVEQYLGCTPTVFQSNLMWSFQKKRRTQTVAQVYHRDWDNFRFCVLFVYLTDVNKLTGPHQYIRKTHTVNGISDAIERYRATGKHPAWAKPETFYREAVGVSDRSVEDVFAGDITQIEQPAGYAFLADAFGLHRGLPLLEGERLLFWTRYGLYDNGFSADVSPAPLPRAALAGRIGDDATRRYIFRSVVQSEFTPAVLPTSIHPSADDFDTQSDKLIARFGKSPFVRKAIKLLTDRLLGRKSALPRQFKLYN